jgi:glutathione synthase/RimK-type ligase-like ATP-grasp enzyme
MLPSPGTLPEYRERGDSAFDVGNPTMSSSSPRRRIGLVTSSAAKLRDYFPTVAEPDFVPTEPPFTPDDQLLVDELRRHGHSVHPIIWGCPIETLVEGIDLLVVRSPWDYMDSDELRQRFLDWIIELERAGIPVENHPRLMACLMDKRYLKDLEAVGVPIVPSQIVSANESVRLIDLYQSWGPLIVKPCISAAGAGLVFLETETDAAAFQAEFEGCCRRKSYLVQPFIPEIRTAGEWSLVYLGGTYRHAAHKLPAAGGILVHAEQGGSLRFAQPPAPVRMVGDLAISTLPMAFELQQERHGIRFPPLYLRVDVIQTQAGPILSECEGVEPELFFRARLASAQACVTLLEERMEM